MKPILRNLIFACIFLSGSSCTKTINDLKADYVLGVLTTGSWFLENYTENDVDITSRFSEYEFKFYDGGKMDAISGSSTVPGSWSGDPANLSFTVNLQTTDQKLTQLNYVWKWLKSNVGVVFAEHVTPAQKISIRLRKKQ